MNKKDRQRIIEENIKPPSIAPELIDERPNRSLFIRHMDCGSCNACELELNALNNPVYDLAQYGIRFEASPRHADIIAMTGCFTRALKGPALATVEAMPTPRIISIGDCADDGGIFKDTYATIEKPPEIKNAIVAHVPGCPPTPEEILLALLILPLPFRHQSGPTRFAHSS